MPPLSWNEIKDRALAFSREWADETSESAEAKSFWDAFFNVFGITRRRIASFEAAVKKHGDAGGFIDLFWKGTLLVEHKSRGRNLDKAYNQAIDYFPGIAERDLPRYIIVSDFAQFRLYDLDKGEEHDFPLADLYKNIRLFGFIAGYQTHEVKPEDPANIEAAELMGKLHDQLKAIGYQGHDLELYLVRLLFCLFADDTSIFERGQFQDYIEVKTAEDGSDLAGHIDLIFYVLNTPESKRLKNLDELQAAFPHVNGKLFEERLPPASFNSEMRHVLLDCCALDWSLISPAIFGSLFQSVMNRELRRNLGAHYTTEQNILKVIRPLFLDDLREEFERIKRSKPKLVEFQKKLAGMKFFDPACGCGNFLVIAYRELRLLELEVLKILFKSERNRSLFDVSHLVLLDVDQFYGIEIEEFPAQIAQVALWMTDHQMNMMLSEEFGQYFRRLPLKKAPNIVCGNALQLDWEEVVPANETSFIYGNPPFVGAKYMNVEQREDVALVFKGMKSQGLLDYVAAWYVKAAEQMRLNPAIRTAFVSTNSITQGEQVGVLWSHLLGQGLKIHFAHRTFQWSSEARGKAAVHCVIIGFGLDASIPRQLYDYDTVQSDPVVTSASNINPYLVDAGDSVLFNRSQPICDVPRIGIGNKPIDGGNYLFKPDEKGAFLEIEPQAKPYFRKWVGSVEFINNIERWCLWLGDCSPSALKQMPESMKRIEAVRQMRLASKSAPTQKLAETPTRFHVENMPDGNSLVVPKVSSIRRPYIPVGFISSEILASDLVFLIPNATLFHFGIISSFMHMAWVRSVCGRLKSDYRYSAGIVYNNFPWPEPTEKQKQAIEDAAQGVLDAREQYPESSLADLYDPLTMPYVLLKAHQKLDKAVDAAYGKRKFNSEADRVAFLFERYEAIVEPLLAKEQAAKRKKAKGRRRKKG